MSIFLTLRTTWHALALSSCVWGFSKLSVFEALAEADTSHEYGGHYQFLTVCSLAATVLAMSVALLLDFHDALLGGGTANSGLRGILTFLKALTSVVAMPVETLVSILFWSIFTYDPNLLVPPIERYDPQSPGLAIKVPVKIPIEIDLALHAAPSLFLLVDYLVFSPPFFKSMKPAAVSTTLTIAYCVWVERCAFKNGHFPYPLLDPLTDAQRYGLYGLCALILVGVLTATQALHTVLDRDVFERTWPQKVEGEQQGLHAKAKATAKEA
ncbi:hypothetical protein K437DRAFT_258649 [Tilletiaria anomala UBC 951]|uniref:FAR-17a/AIG1-like protein n=1 Tax=Tilletiaria anomala (strain ATCC 24038 / CBS 436.72 / UBC 951) TaxID=1037660 RepID=A0A066VNU0_TILAU|nr:uncharacterized protein K437DRAFT_258649 [Tilletiaria anomala UBC 951]KDN40424.1 hypothetical protein K437DRAFT_258649 [Tilletiaria anomala UBC 951]